MSIIEQLKFALGRLTCLPIGGRLRRGHGIADAAMALPLVGLAMGFLGALAFALAFYFGLTSWLAAILAALALTALYAARPEHGLCRFVEGLSGPGPEARLLRLKGETLGAPAVIVLVAAFLLRSGALMALGAPVQVFNGLIAAGAISLAMVAFATYLLAPAIAVEPADRTEEDAGPAPRERADPVHLAWALLIAAIVAVISLGFGTALAASLAAVAASLAVLALAQSRYGGQSDEALGAVQIAAEIAALLAAIAVVGTTD